MTQRVEEFELPVKWDPNVEEVVLAASEEGTARLVLTAYPDDPDRSPV
jgi:hypothetical protein